MKMNLSRNLLAFLALGSIGNFLNVSTFAGGELSLPLIDEEGAERRPQSNRSVVSGTFNPATSRHVGSAFPSFNATALVEEYINSPETTQRLASAFADIAKEHDLDPEQSEQLKDLASRLSTTMGTLISSSRPEGGPLQLPAAPIPADDAFQSALKGSTLLMKYAQKLPQSLEDYLYSRILQLNFMSDRLKDFYLSSNQNIFGNDYFAHISFNAAVATMKFFADAVTSAAEIQHRRYRNAHSDYTHILSVSKEFESIMKLIVPALEHLKNEDLFVRRLVMTEINSMLDFASLLMPLIDVIFSNEDVSGQFKANNKSDFEKLENHLKNYHLLRQKLEGVHTDFGNELLEYQTRQEEKRIEAKKKQKEIDDSFLPDHLKQKDSKQPSKKTSVQNRGKKKKMRGQNQTHIKGNAVISSKPIDHSPVISESQEVAGKEIERLDIENTLASQSDGNDISKSIPEIQKKEKEIASPSPVEVVSSPTVEAGAELEEVKEKAEEERIYLQEWVFEAAQEEVSQESEDVRAAPIELPPQPTPPSIIPLPTGKNAATTVHTPHVSRGNSRGSQNLRTYHVENLREMFRNGGYSLETVSENRKYTKAPKPGHFFLAGGFRTFQQIMEGTYNGKMDSIVSLVVEHFGGKAQRSNHNVWHFKINSLGKQRQIFWNLDMPQLDNS